MAASRSRRLRAFALALAAVGSGSCYTSDRGRLERFPRGGERESFFLSEGDEPIGAMPLSLVSVQLTGWYLLGFIPVVPVTLEIGIQMLEDEARRLGAEGVAHISILYEPTSFLRFSVFPLPDWSASLFISGMAFKRGREVGPPVAPAR